MAYWGNHRFSALKWARNPDEELVALYTTIGLQDHQQPGRLPVPPPSVTLSPHHWCMFSW
jgi:hypothetical protein